MGIASQFLLARVAPHLPVFVVCQWGVLGVFPFSVLPADTWTVPMDSHEKHTASKSQVLAVQDEYCFEHYAQARNWNVYLDFVMELAPCANGK